MRRILGLMAPFLFFIFGLTCLGFLLMRTSVVNAENNHYLRVLTCLGSIPTEIKTAENVEKCWKTVEKSDGIMAPRYDQDVIYDRLR